MTLTVKIALVILITAMLLIAVVLVALVAGYVEHEEPDVRVSRWTTWGLSVTAAYLYVHAISWIVSS